ncbi:hypothetical protein [Luteolibacter soli]|uniref:Uncharacterized protein n=1 Tax=Luteolibacter soli TaxID=3135280 RepID=A0ABU9ANI7_9BACT
MNPDDLGDFEQQLLGMELRRPPAEWKAFLLPKPVPPLLPKPLLIFCAASWAATIGFIITKPESEDLGPPILPPSQQATSWNNALAYQPDMER